MGEFVAGGEGAEVRGGDKVTGRQGDTKTRSGTGSRWLLLAVLIGLGAGLEWLAGEVGPGLVLRAVAAGAGPGVLLGVIGAMRGRTNGWTLLLVLVQWGLAGCGVWWLVGLVR